MSAMEDQPTPMDIDGDLTSSPPPMSPANANANAEKVPKQNGTNGTMTPNGEEEAAPRPPPHRVPTSPPTQQAPAPEPVPAAPEKPAVDAEACKITGNKFFKAKEYEKAIKEYSKGMHFQPEAICHRKDSHFERYSSDLENMFLVSNDSVWNHE